MTNRTTNRKGSALVLVLVASLFLIILTAGAFRYFQTNVKSQIWTRDRIQAKLSAEAGANLATHMLIAGASLPTDLNPAPILGTELSFFDLPGELGSVFACVDPSDSNEVVTSANAYMIRCIANVPGTTIETFGVRSIVMPENLARFSVFMNNPSTSGYYGDGYRFDGPFYANGPVRVQSSSATHDADPFFYSFRLTSDYYLASGSVHQTTPSDGGNLEMRPFERLTMGAPYFELGIDPIPFGEDELDWEGVRSAAMSGGLVLNNTDVPDFSRLALKGDTLLVKSTITATVDSYYLGGMDNPVVWIENEGQCIYLRGSQLQGLSMALTIGCMGDVRMSGNLHYENPDPQDPDNNDLLGIITVRGNMIIAEDQGAQLGWLPECFRVRTDNGFDYSAVLVALEGNLLAEDWTEPDPGPVEFRIIGGYMIQEEGYTSTNTTGYEIGVYFDPRLLFMHPPFFPTTANWNTTMWAEDPGMSTDDVYAIGQY